MAEFTFSDTVSADVARDIVCDPRLAYSTFCWGENAREWHDALDYWYTVLAVYLMVVSFSGIGYCILKFGRTGFSLSLPYQLPVIQGVAGLIALVRVFLILGTKGNWFHPGGDTNDILWIDEVLFSLPFTMSTFGYILLVLFFEKLFRMKSNKEFKVQSPRQLYREVQKRSVGYAIPLLLATIAAAILTGNNPKEYRLPAYLITVFFTVAGMMLVMYKLVKSQVGIEDLLKKDAAKFRMIRHALLLGSCLWVATTFFYSVYYQELVSYHSPWPWMVMMGLQYVFFGINVSTMGALTLSKEFSDRGIEMFKPTVLITLDGQNTRTVSVTDLTGDTSKQSQSRNSGNSANACSISAAEDGKCDLCVARLEAKDLDLALARDMPWWNKKPESLRDFFKFPHPVNENDSRVHAGLCSLLMIIIWITAFTYDWPWVYVYLIFGFFARCAAGPSFDPQGWLVQGILSPYLAKVVEPVYVAGPPKRMAQFVGMCFSAASFILFMLDQRLAAFWVMATLFSFTTLQCVHNLCAACLMFYIMSVMGLIPKSVLEKSVQKFAAQTPGSPTPGESVTVKTLSQQNTRGSRSHSSDTEVEVEMEVKDQPQPQQQQTESV